MSAIEDDIVSIVRSKEPRFQGRHLLCGLFSVRGNKNFRTTVSRTTLEQDEAYFRVARIFLKLMFNHIEDEVNRISSMADKPLSQASTAAKWLFISLSRSVNSQDMENYLTSLYRQLPLLVIEKFEPKVNVIDRQLIDIEQFSKMDRFWTIEARLVDYLGIISRDLGRELSLNDFLSSFAPDFLNPDTTLLVPDAHQFGEIMFTSHTVVKGEFSRKNQQTVLEWHRKEIDLDDIEKELLDIREDSAEALMLAGNQYLRRGRGDLARYLIRNIESNRVIVASVTGDVAEVQSIRTRIVTILDPEIALSKTFDALNKATLQVIKDHQNIKIRAPVLLGYALLKTLFSEKSYWPTQQIRSYTYRSNEYHIIEGRRGVPIEDLFEAWQQLVEPINSVFKSIGLNQSLSGDLEGLWNEVGLQFDASDYWRNWERQEEEF